MFAVTSPLSITVVARSFCLERLVDENKRKHLTSNFPPGSLDLPLFERGCKRGARPLVRRGGEIIFHALSQTLCHDPVSGSRKRGHEKGKYPADDSEQLISFRVVSSLSLKKSGKI